MPSESFTSARGRAGSRVTVLEWLILMIGLVGGVVSGVAAYRVVGIYGDNALNPRFRRVHDPVTGDLQIVQDFRGPEGEPLRRVVDYVRDVVPAIEGDFDDDGRQEQVFLNRAGEVTQVGRDLDGDGVVDVIEYAPAASGLQRTGFSLAGNGVIDAWAYRDEGGRLVRVDVSTRQDGVVDRREYYDDSGQLARVELDTDRDGRADRWQVYDAGILLDTIQDADGDGAPDSPLP